LDRTQRAEEFNESVDKIIGSTKKLNSMLDYGKYFLKGVLVFLFENNTEL
jgi:hypothetical protein